MEKRVLFIKNICCFMCLFVFASNVYSVPALRKPFKVVQPDGTTLIVRLNGDEFNHYTTTEDGYTVLKNAEGAYMYAEKNSQGYLVAGKIKARDMSKRDKDETAYLLTVSKRLKSANNQSKLKIKSLKNPSATSPKKSYPLLGSPKSLVILANFKDKSFSVNNPQTSFQNLLTQTGYSDNGGTGSAKDYFKSSSYGKFSPDFVVVGPVTLPYTLDYYGKNDTNDQDSNPTQMIVDACAAADAIGVDFKQFDTDNDGYIDNIFVYYAGYNEAEGGASNTIWPHRWSLNEANYSGNRTFDGKIVNDYSCTSELKGSSGTNMCGIGTFCHEFGHVLGLPDFYYTDSSDSYVPCLETFDIMDYGPYLNDGNTPPSYSAYERFYLGFLTPQEKNSPEVLTLQPLYLGTTTPASTDGQSYLLSASTHNLNGSNPNPTEFFLVEYRKHQGFDTYLGQEANGDGTFGVIPSDGMCIWHIDYNQSDWDNNSVNNYTGTNQTASSHMRVYLQPLSGSTATPGDIFTSGVFTPTTWNGIDINRKITDITPNANSLTFKLMGGVAFGSFQALDATNVTSTSFTANWTSSSNATQYLLDVYQKNGTPTTTTQGFTSTPSSWTFSGTSTYTSTGNYGAASPSIKMSTTGNYIQTETFANSISSLSFWLKGMPGSGAITSTLKIQGSPDGNNWTDIANISSISSIASKPSYSIETSKGYKIVKFLFNKLSGNVGIDDVVITTGDKTYVLKDQIVSTGTSYDVAGLTGNGSYYYTVKASDGSESSSASNEIEVILKTTDLSIAPQGDNYRISINRSDLNVESKIKSEILIYNSQGQLVVNRMINVGLNKIRLQPNQLYIAKIAGNQVKVMTR